MVSSCVRIFVGLAHRLAIVTPLGSACPSCVRGTTLIRYGNTAWQALDRESVKLSRSKKS
jgi:hypothetical protein